MHAADAVDAVASAFKCFYGMMEVRVWIGLTKITNPKAEPCQNATSTLYQLCGGETLLPVCYQMNSGKNIFSHGLNFLIRKVPLIDECSNRKE